MGCFALLHSDLCHDELQLRNDKAPAVSYGRLMKTAITALYATRFR